MAFAPQTATPIVPVDGMGLYIHFPFCKTKCPYCDFNTYQGIENLIGPYQEAVAGELGLWGRVLETPTVNTIFMGGGTPSYLPGDHIGRILVASQEAFLVRDNAEITVEANPDDLSPSKCGSMLSQGVNRLSIGVQSLDADLLAQLGRRHGPEQAIEAFQTAQAAGFTNINLDLMYGLPRQTMPQWEDTVQKIASLGAAHLSLYCLTLEEGTPLHRWVQEGELPVPDEDLAADMYSYARTTLADAGYQHYEVSNWCLPGREAWHNIGYWRNLPYLGVGPGAHSSLGSYRFWQVSSPRLYISRVKEWADSNPEPIVTMAEVALDTVRPIGGWEHIDVDTASSETMFLGLRLLNGLDLKEASARAGLDLESRYQTQIRELLELGLLEREDGRLRLNSSAYLIANQVFTRFVD